MNIKSPTLKDVNEEYATELVMNILDYGPEVFKVSFCGEEIHVSDFLYVATFMYLNRGFRMPDEQKVAWLNADKAKFDGLASVVTIVAIYLAAKDNNKLDKFIESINGN